jgi:hypothetical protein
MNSYRERKAIREQLDREKVEGVSIDAGQKCKCSQCGDIHFRKKEPNEETKDQVRDR